MASSPAEYYQFGEYKISPSEVFYTTEHSFCFVNISPVLPGHIIVCPRREAKRFTDLTDAEVTDLWVTAQKVSTKMEQYLKATSLTFSIQDGPQAGQSISHVHIHVIPRKHGDIERNDDIYDAIDERENELKKKLEENNDLAMPQVATEADVYRMLFL